ncbi:ABC transporter substrate-binding protein, partial [Thermoplasma sp.]|uniref:ABC transporter substrate-binding protein n=1 Tax=Thermoplasma sp. TaxID=1973142 RepID=UPI0026311523
TNEYIDSNGMPGTGPYMISAIGASLSSITLVSNPHYWGIPYWQNKDLPAVAQPAHISTLILDYGIEHSGRVSGFLDNDYQISYVSIPYIGSIAGASPYDSMPLNSFFKNFGANPGVIPWSMNTQVYPTNILDFRKAVEYAINYTEIEHPYYYMGQYLAQNYIGPISPQFSNYYDNATRGLAPQQYNLTKAEYYLNLAGEQGKFFVTLPNGTILGDKALAKKYTVLALSGLNEIILLQEMIYSAEAKILASIL